MRWCEPTRFRAHWCWKGWSVDVHCNDRKTIKSCCSVCLEGAASFNPSASSNNSTALSSNFKLGLKRLRSFQQLFKNIQKHSKTKPQCQTSVPKCTKHHQVERHALCMIHDVSLWFFMYLYVIWCNFASWNAHRLTMTDLPRCKQTQLKATLH